MRLRMRLKNMSFSLIILLSFQIFSIFAYAENKNQITTKDSIDEIFIGDAYQDCLDVFKKKVKMNKNCFFPELHATDRGGVSALDHLFQRVFMDIKDFINSIDINLKYTNLSQDEQEVIQWLNQKSNRDERLSNMNMLRYIQSEKISLYFLPYSIKYCETSDETSPQKAALCFNFESTSNIEIARSAVEYVMGLDTQEREREVFSLLFHELIHFAGNSEHQFASIMGLKTYKLFKKWKQDNLVVSTKK